MDVFALVSLCSPRSDVPLCNDTVRPENMQDSRTRLQRGRGIQQANRGDFLGKVMGRKTDSHLRAGPHNR